jgi:hypothetical protein
MNRYTFRFSYEDKASEEVVINSAIVLDTNYRRKRLFNHLLKQNPTVTEITLLS